MPTWGGAVKLHPAQPMTVDEGQRQGTGFCAHRTVQQGRTNLFCPGAELCNPASHAAACTLATTAYRPMLANTMLEHAEAAKMLDLLRPYVAFNANLRSSFSALIQRLGLTCASLLRQQVCSWVLS